MCTDVPVNFFVSGTFFEESWVKCDVAIVKQKNKVIVKINVPISFSRLVELDLDEAQPKRPLFPFDLNIIANFHRKITRITLLLVDRTKFSSTLDDEKETNTHTQTHTHTIACIRSLIQ